MRTEDFTVPKSSEWIVIPYTTTQTVVCNIGNAKIAVRFGADSVSEGQILNENDTMVVDETIYLRALDTKAKTPKVAVTR